MSRFLEVRKAALFLGWQSCILDNVTYQETVETSNSSSVLTELCWSAGARFDRPLFHLKLYSWQQQFVEASRWCRSDFSFHPWQLFYLLARLLTVLSVCVCSEQSDPGSDRSSGGDQLYRLPPPPGRALQRGRIDPAAVGPSAPAVQHDQRRSQQGPGLIVLHLRHATLQIFCPKHHVSPHRPPGHL